MKRLIESNQLKSHRLNFRISFLDLNNCSAFNVIKICINYGNNNHKHNENNTLNNHNFMNPKNGRELVKIGHLTSPKMTGQKRSKEREA